MTRCSAALRGNVYGGGNRKWEPSGAEIQRAIIRKEKLKLYKSGKCKKCAYFGIPADIVRTLRETWGKNYKKPTKKDYYCLLYGWTWMEYCKNKGDTV